MQYRHAVLVATLVVLAHPVDAAKVVDRVAAVVNEDIILESEVEQYALPMMRAPIDTSTDAGKKQMADLKRKALDNLIESKLVQQQASELKLVVSNDEVDR